MFPTHVLVVDDDPTIREVVCLALLDEGYQVQSAEDGLIALHLIRTSIYPLVILLDHMMPRLDGTGVLNFLASDPAVADKHIIIFTTAANRVFPPAVVEEMHRLHVSILRKPFELDDLMAQIEQAASRLST